MLDDRHADPILHPVLSPAGAVAWWVAGPARALPRHLHPWAANATARHREARRALAEGSGTAAPWSRVARGLSARQRLVLPASGRAPARPGDTVDGWGSWWVPLAMPSAVDTLASLRVAVPPRWETSPATDYLRSFVADLTRLVGSGRVLPSVQHALSGPRATWRLVDDADVTAWVRARAAAFPPALLAGDPRMADADAQEWAGLTAWAVARLLSSWTPLLVLERLEVHGATANPGLPWRTCGPLEPSPDRASALSTALAGWAASERTRTFGLVLGVHEPDVPDTASVSTWPVLLGLSVDGSAPVRPSGLEGDEEALAAVRTALADALAAAPALADGVRDPLDPDVLWLSSETLLELVAQRAALTDANVRLLVPATWREAQVSLHLTASGKRDAAIGLAGIVTWDWAVAVGDERLTDEELSLLAAGAGDLVRLRGQWVRFDRRSLAAARRHVHERGSGEGGSLAELLDELTADDVPVPVTSVTGEGWVHGLFADPGSMPLVPGPAALRATLRPYQRRGLSWLAFMDSRGLGAVLADDMGLGKTIQVLALLLHERETHGPVGPTLLLAPTSLLSNWAREASRFAPSLRVAVRHGTARDRLSNLPDADLVVTSYGTAVNDVEDLAALDWHRLVLDEAQAVKNSRNKQAAAVRRIGARHRLVMTGTPVENRLEEFRALLDTVNPGILGSAAAFHQRFGRRLEQDRDPVAVSQFQALTRPFVLRRVKTDPTIIDDLPDKVEQVVTTRLTAEQAGLYRAKVDELLTSLPRLSAMGRRAAVLGTLMALKQICNHPAHFLGDGSPLVRRSGHRSGKFDVIDELVQATLDRGEKMLLFTQFTAFGDLLVPYLRRRFGVDVPFLSGSSTRRQRDDMVRRFGDPDGPRLFLLSLKAGGTGLNLPAASQVLHLDRWWNPAVENQATDRAYRIGQRRTVFVHKLMTAGTVEERIDQVIRDKASLADLAVGGGESWITEMGDDQLADLLRLDEEATS